MSVRTTMPILVLFVEFPTFSNHKITHNAFFSKNVVERRCHSDCKLNQNI